MIKILVIGNYSNYISARPEAEIYLSLSKNPSFQIEIMTAAKSEYGQKFIDAGISVINHTPTSKVSKKTISLIKSRLEKEQFNIMVLYNSKAIINGIIASKNNKTKIVLYRGCAGNISWLDPSMYLKYLHPRVDKIICNAYAAQELFEKQVGFKKGKAVTIHKGHDPIWYQNTTTSELSNFNIPEKSFTICCVANARPVKGIKYLLNAFNFLPPDLPIYLLLLGRGHDTKENLSIIQNSSYQNKIQLLGFREDSLSIVKSTDVFVLPSTGQETLTKSVIEAMSLSSAPIITDIPGNKELVINGQSGLIVPIKDSKAISDSILKLYQNKSLTEQLQKNAKERIAQVLSHEKTVMEYGNFFKSLCN